MTPAKIVVTRESRQLTRNQAKGNRVEILTFLFAFIRAFRGRNFACGAAALDIRG